MRRGTTPTITATVNADLSSMTLYLAFKQANADLMVKSGDDLSVTIDGEQTVITCELTQTETLALQHGDVKIQLRAVADGGDTAIATNIVSVPVETILQDGVLNG